MEVIRDITSSAVLDSHMDIEIIKKFEGWTALESVYNARKPSMAMPQVHTLPLR